MPEKTRVLVVDDDEMVRETMKSMLSMIGYDVHLAKNGAEGVNIYRKIRPCLTVMDFRMPVMNGIEAAKKIREEFPDANIVFFSSNEKPKGNQKMEWIDKGKAFDILEKVKERCPRN